MEPFGFFSVDALRAGWYLIWRQFVRVLPVGAGSVLIGIFLMSRRAASARWLPDRHRV